MITVIRWIIAAVLFVFFLGTAFTNAWTIFRFYLRGEKGSSLPIFGGLAGVFSVLIAPIGQAWHWCWVPLIFDFWTLPSAFFWLRSKFKANRQS